MNSINKDSLIMITGSAGGLGNAIVKNLKKKGFQRLLTPSRHELDLLDAKVVSGYISDNRPDAILHLASIVFGLQGNIDNQMLSLVENTQINNNLFSAIEKFPVKYIFFAGTVASYPYPFVKMPLKESDFFNGLPHSGEFGYAMSKRHVYSYLQILSEIKNIKFTYGIFTNLYGEYDRFNENSGHVIPSLITKAYKASQVSGKLSVWGDGSAQRDFLHFEDAAEAVFLCMLSNGRQSLINISSGVPVTIQTLSQLISKAAGLNNINYLTDKPVGIKSRVADNNLLKSLGFKQSIDLKNGISNLYNWYVANLTKVRV